MPDEVSVTIKGGEHSAEPWITIRSETVEGVAKHVNDVIATHFSVLLGEATLDLRSKSAAAGLGAKPVAVPTASGYVTNPQLQSTVAQSVSTAPAAPASGLETKTDNFGNVFTFGIPGAPTCPHGPRVQKLGKNKKDEPYTAWVCSVPARDYKNKTDCVNEYVR